MKIAVLVKQIPAPAQLRLDGATVVRDGVDLEVNAYCRRANAKAVELAGDTGEVVVFTMGPPSAEDALREMLACGATRAVHLCDLAFAGADTLATARVLAKAIEAEGQFDLVLAGLNSLDADTGQVPAQVAEFLGLPFAPGIRDIEVTNDRFTARLETDDDYLDAEGRFPAMLSTAERLCAPSKAKPEQRAAVDGLLIKRLDAAALGMPLDECGVLGSPTTVGEVRVVESKRAPKMAASAAEAVDMLVELGAFAESDDAQAEVLLRQVENRDVLLDRRDPGPRAIVEFGQVALEPLQHLVGQVDPGHPVAGGGQRHGDAAGSATQLQNLAAGVGRDLQVTIDVVAQPLEYGGLVEVLRVVAEVLGGRGGHQRDKIPQRDARRPGALRWRSRAWREARDASSAPISISAQIFRMKPLPRT